MFESLGENERVTKKWRKGYFMTVWYRYLNYIIWSYNVKFLPLIWQFEHLFERKMLIRKCLNDTCSKANVEIKSWNLYI